MRSSASSQETRWTRPSPLAPIRRNGISSRPGPCTHSGYEVATLVQITPAVYGLAREPRTRTIREFSTVTERLQVSGQSRGQTLACSVLMSAHGKRTGAGTPLRARPALPSGVALRRIKPDDLVEPAKADVERCVRDQLDDLGLRELAPQLGPERVVDLLVVDRELLREPDRGPLARGQEIRALVVDRGDLRFRRSRMPGPGIAQGESIAAGVETGDLQPHQFTYDRVDRAFAREGGAEGGERLEHAGVLPVGPCACRGAGLALGLFTEVPDLFVDLVDSQRLDPRHDRLLAQGRFPMNSGTCLDEL